MSNLQLIRKFRPIFIFSKGEKYYPVNKKFLMDHNTNERYSIDVSLGETENLTSPQEPLYYHLLEEDESEIAVVYTLIFPYSLGGFFNVLGKRGDILSCLAVINKKTKTLKEIYYWNKDREIFDIKTTRPVIFVTANDHHFRKEMGKEMRGFRWEPEKIEDFNLKKLGDMTLEGKRFDQFLSIYNI